MNVKQLTATATTPWFTDFWLVVTLAVCALLVPACTSLDTTTPATVLDVAIKLDMIERDIAAERAADPDFDLEAWGAERLAQELGLDTSAGAGLALLEYAAGVPPTDEASAMVDLLVSRVPGAEAYEGLLNRIVTRWRGDISAP